MNFDQLVCSFEGGCVEPVGNDMCGRLKADWIQLRVSLLLTTQMEMLIKDRRL